MKREMIRILALSGMVVVSAVSVPSIASAFSITSDKPAVSIDGDKDKRVTLRVSKKDSSGDSHSYGYFLNDSKEFTKLDDSESHSFRGGDKIDFAVYDSSKTKYYKLSNGSKDDSYDVEVALDEDEEEKDGYHSAHIKWSIPEESNSKEFCLDLDDGNNGYTAVPEPATLFIMGSGLVGYALMRRKKRS